MPIPRQYTLDIDTKRYLNRVNTYRLLNGLPNIANSDAVDIDNFVIGLKDLGIWSSGEIWLMSNRYNVGAGQNICSLFDSKKTGIAVGNIVWEIDGIKSTGLGNPPPYIQLLNTKKTNYFTRNIISIFMRNALTLEEAYLLTSNYNLGFASPSGEGFFFSTLFQWGVSLNRTSLSQTVNNNQRVCLSSALNFNQAYSFRNGASKNTTTRVAFPIADTNNIRCMAMQGGGLNDRGLNGTMSLAADFDKALDDSTQLSFYNLCKATIGKTLGLP